MRRKLLFERCPITLLRHFYLSSFFILAWIVSGWRGRIQPSRYLPRFEVDDEMRVSTSEKSTTLGTVPAAAADADAVIIILSFFSAAGLLVVGGGHRPLFFWYGNQYIQQRSTPRGKLDNF